MLRKNRVLSSGAQNFAAKLAAKYRGPYEITKKAVPRGLRTKHSRQTDPPESSY